MNKSSGERNCGPVIGLRELEEEVLIEGREWMRQRLEDRLREKAKAFFPGRGKEAQGHPTPEADP